jgi:two-component system CheB/CheR fusion protein
MTSGTKAKRILVIDDHPEGARSLRDLLVVFGHEATIASSGEEGLEMIRERGPDVVFCDYRLPGMGGADVARAVRSDPRIASTYLISLTAYDDDRFRREALEAGFDVHLVKPPEIDELERMLEGPLESGR